ncbi:hypothetical protein BGZ49_009526 [Haplosporangium sp. Z 27]|nr:hypothetical protein BGZ49_009526 [Haplosporangium sp. Z 27]
MWITTKLEQMKESPEKINQGSEKKHSTSGKPHSSTEKAGLEMANLVLGKTHVGSENTRTCHVKTRSDPEKARSGSGKTRSGSEKTRSGSEKGNSTSEKASSSTGKAHLGSEKTSQEFPWHQLPLGELPTHIEWMRAKGYEKLASVPFSDIVDDFVTSHFFSEPTSKESDGSQLILNSNMVYCRVKAVNGSKECLEGYKPDMRRAMLSHLWKKHGKIFETVLKFRDLQEEHKRLAKESVQGDGVGKLDQKSYQLRLALERLIQGHSFSALECPYYCSTMGSKTYQCTVPNTATIMKSVHQLQTKIVRKNLDVLQDIPSGSFSTVTWKTGTDVLKNRRTLTGFVFHWITENFENKELILGILPETKKVGDDRFDDRSSFVVENWPIKEKLIAGTTKISGISKDDKLPISVLDNVLCNPCIVESLQTWTSYAINQAKGTTELIDRCKDIGKLLWDNPLIKWRFEEVSRFKNEEMAPFTSHLDQADSQYRLMELLLKSDVHLKYIRDTDSWTWDWDLRRKFDMHRLTIDELCELQDTIKVLKPIIELLTLIKSTKDFAISRVYSDIWAVTDTIQQIESPLDENSQELQKILVKILQNVWTVQSMPDHVFIATYLNPVAKEDETFLYVTIDKNNSTTTFESYAQHLIRDELLKMAKQDKSIRISPIEREIKSYSEVKLKEQVRELYLENPLAWWQQKAQDGSFPYLCRIARKYHSIQASISPSELLFSDAQQLIDDRSHPLNDNDLANTLFIRRGMKCLEENGIQLDI